MPQRVIVVTGASGGIGSAIAEAFTALGDAVVGLDLLDGFDVTDPGACADAAARIEAERGAVDVLCNNAGSRPSATSSRPLPRSGNASSR